MPLRPRDQEELIKFRDLLCQIPNPFIVGPGDGINWKDDNFDEYGKPIMDQFTSRNIPFYNPKALYMNMERRFLKKTNQTKRDPWHFASNQQTKAKMVEALSMVQDMHDMRINLLNISRLQQHKQEVTMAWKLAGGDAEPFETRKTSLEECRRRAALKSSKAHDEQPSTPQRQKRERTPRFDRSLQVKKQELPSPPVEPPNIASLSLEETKKEKSSPAAPPTAPPSWNPTGSTAVNWLNTKVSPRGTPSPKFVAPQLFDGDPLPNPDGTANPQYLRDRLDKIQSVIDSKTTFEFAHICQFCGEGTNISCSRCHQPLCKDCEQASKCCAMVVPEDKPSASSSSKGPQQDAEQDARIRIQSLADAASSIANQASGNAEQYLDELVDEAEYECSICKSHGSSHLCCMRCEYFVCIECI